MVVDASEYGFSTIKQQRTDSSSWNIIKQGFLWLICVSSISVRWSVDSIMCSKAMCQSAHCEFPCSILGRYVKRGSRARPVTSWGRRERLKTTSRAIVADCRMCACSEGRLRSLIHTDLKLQSRMALWKCTNLTSERPWRVTIIYSYWWVLSEFFLIYCDIVVSHIAAWCRSQN